MNVDPTALVRHFGFSIEQDDPSVKCKGAIRLRCPLHQDGDMTLRAVRSQSSTTFHCIHPGCRFEGDAIALVSLARGTTIRDAVAMFRPGGEFSDCLVEPMTYEEAEAYSSNADQQLMLKAYLEKCRRAARLSPEKTRIRHGISPSSARLLHPDVCLFVGGEPGEVPRCLSEFLKPKYRGSCLVLYPYTKDGCVTKIDVEDRSNPGFRHTVVVTNPNAGAFGEGLVSSAKCIVAVEDPKSAAELYATNALVSGEQLPVVSFQSFPLPDSMCGVQCIRVVSTSDRPVSSAFLARMLSSPCIVPVGSPMFKVFTLSRRTDEVTARELEGIIGGKLKSWDAHELLVRNMIGMVRDGRQAEIVSMLADAQTPVSIRNLLKDTAAALVTGSDAAASDSRQAEELVRVLSSQKIMPISDVRLANRRTIHRGATSVIGTGIVGKEDVLCNVGLSVDSKIVSADGDEIFVCTATHEDSEIPSVEVRIPESAVGDCAKLSRLVSRAFSSRGANPYVAFYSVPGYSWRDIFGKLSEHCPVSREIDRLGVDSASNIHLPDATIRADGTISRQTRVFTLPDQVLRMYSGIPFDDSSGVLPYRSLLERCDNLYVAAFALGVMHAAYQMTFGVFRPDAARDHMMRHLFYVETEPGIWGAVFKQLSELFSGNNFTPTVNYSDPGKTFSEYAKLGCLPLVAYLPTIGNKLSSALDCSGVDLVGLMDTTTAVMTNGKVSAVYVTPTEDSPMVRGIIDGRDVEALRMSFVPFLAKMVSEARIDTAYRSSSMPCVTAYDEACRVLGVARSPIVDRIARSYFPGVGMNGATIFYDLLHRSLVDDGKPSICVVNGEPQRGHSFTRRGQHVFVMKDVVIVSHMVADIYNQSSKGKTKFDIGQLTSEMEATGVLADMPDLGIDASRCWCMSRDAWESRVVRPPINLLDEVKSGTIRLSAIE